VERGARCNNLKKRERGSIGASLRAPKARRGV
jgi:hypothetical protein